MTTGRPGEKKNFTENTGLEGDNINIDVREMMYDVSDRI